MARMRRATIEEAAASLGVAQSEIELQIKSGTLVPCQDPSFRRCVWISESSLPKPKGKARTKPAGDGGSRSLSEPSGEVGVTLATAALPETEPEVTVPRPKRQARATGKKHIMTADPARLRQANPGENAGLLRDGLAEPEISPPRPRRKTRDTSQDSKNNDRTDGIVPVEPGGSSSETGTLQDTIDRLRAELEIRDEQLGQLAVQLELSRQEVRKLRPLQLEQQDSPGKEFQKSGPSLTGIQWFKSAHNDELHQIPAPLPAVGLAGQRSDGEILGTAAEPPASVKPALRTRSGHFGISRRSFRPLVRLMFSGFSLPLFQ